MSEAAAVAFSLERPDLTRVRPLLRPRPTATGT